MLWPVFIRSVFNLFNALHPSQLEENPFILIYILWSWISLELYPLGTGIVDILKKLFVDPNQYEGQGTWIDLTGI